MQSSVLRWTGSVRWQLPRLIFMFGPIKARLCPRNTPGFFAQFWRKAKIGVGGHAPHLHSYAAQGRRGWSMPTIIFIIIVVTIIVNTIVIIMLTMVQQIINNVISSSSSGQSWIKANKGKFGENPPLVIRHSQSGLIGRGQQLRGSLDQNSNLKLSALTKYRKVSN